MNHRTRASPNLENVPEGRDRVEVQVAFHAPDCQHGAVWRELKALYRLLAVPEEGYLVEGLQVDDSNSAVEAAYSHETSLVVNI